MKEQEKKVQVKLMAKLGGRVDVTVKAYGILEQITEIQEEKRGAFLQAALASGDQRITPDNIIPLIDKISSFHYSYKSLIISQIIFERKECEHLITKSNIMYLISNSNDSARCIDNLFAVLNLRKLITPENALDLVNQSENPAKFIKSLVNYSEMQGVITETNIVPLLKNAIAYIKQDKIEGFKKIFLCNFCVEKALNFINFPEVITPSNIKELVAMLGLKAKSFMDKLSQNNMDPAKLFAGALESGLALSTDALPLLTLISQPASEIMRGEQMPPHDPIIDGLLSKIWTNIPNPKPFLIELIDHLQRVVCSNGVLKKILEKAWRDEGNIFISNTNKLDDTGDKDDVDQKITGGFFLKVDSSIKVAALGRDIVSIVLSIIHEATHKLINNFFGNHCHPFRSEDSESFAHIMKAMEVELKISPQLLHLYSLMKHIDDVGVDGSLKMVKAPHKSWVKLMSEIYENGEWDIELPAWFAEQMTEVILDKSYNSRNVTHGLTKELWGFLAKITDCESEALSSSFYAPSPSEIPELSILLEKLQNKPEDTCTFYEYLLYGLPNEVLLSIVNQDKIIHLIEAVPCNMYAALIFNLFYHERPLSSLVTSKNLIEIIKALPESERAYIAQSLGELRPEDAQKLMKFMVEGHASPRYVLEALGKSVPENLRIYKKLGYEKENIQDRLCRLILPKSKGGYADDVVTEETKEDISAPVDNNLDHGDEIILNSPSCPLVGQGLTDGAFESWMSSEL